MFLRPSFEFPGNVDMLLHLLSNIANLPVTKSIVKSSGMGKAVGTIDKHSICSGSPNEESITGRVEKIKEAWKKSVKIRKGKDDTPKPTIATAENSHVAAKRKIEPASPVTAKRAKSEEDVKKGTSLSKLLKKVSGPVKQQSSPPPKSNGQHSTQARDKTSPSHSKPIPARSKKYNSRRFLSSSNNCHS